MSLLQKALDELKIVPVGTEFTVKDLFLGYYWNSLPITDRLTLGTLFMHNIQGLPVEKIHKNAANQQLYKKL